MMAALSDRGPLRLLEVTRKRRPDLVGMVEHRPQHIGVQRHRADAWMEIAMARTLREHGPLTAAFERFFLEAARAACPEGGFAAPTGFRCGAELNLISK